MRRQSWLAGHLELLSSLLFSLLLELGIVDLVLTIHQAAELLNLGSEEFSLLL